MKIKTNAENERLLSIVDVLRKEQKPFWRRVAELLAKPKRHRPEVNLRKIEKLAKEGDTIVVPGKVLGDGRLTKKVNVVAFNFSESAKKIMEEAGAKYMEIEEYYKKNKEAKDAIILT
ncbi:MAG: 50S ribosomal protein L18e [Candidatus Anstonellales archaeon]